MKYFLQDFFKENFKAKLFDRKWEKYQKSIEKYQNQIKRNIKRLGNLEDMKSPDSQSLKIIYEESQKYWKQHKTFKGMSSRKLRELFFILFPNPNDGVRQGIYESPEQFDDFLNIQKNKQSALRRLMSVLLHFYPEESSLLFKRLDKVYRALEKNKKRNALLITANKKFKLIEKSGPEIIARQILNPNKNMDDLLQEIWIKERDLSHGIGKSILKELCQLAWHNIANEAILDRFLEYLSGESINSPSGFSVQSFSENEISGRYNNIKPVVSTLLLPFENKIPAPSFKKKITWFLDKHIGDPRFQSEKWIALSKEKEIFQSWKVGETIQDFFALLDYTAKTNPTSDRMWPLRKKFIEFYLNAGHIVSAWIVLGKEAYKNRLEFLKEGVNDYGTITRGANPIHSVLLFQISDLVLSEWNYNGKVRIWNKAHPQVPRFYKKQYEREGLVKDPEQEIIHHHSEKYYWQKNLSDYIEKYTGIPCPEDLQKEIDKFR